HKHKVTWMIKYAPYWYGKHGFTSPKAVKKEIKSINVGDLNEIAIKLLTSGKAVKENNLIVLNLVEMGYDKVLGKGKVSLPLKILVKKITEEARKKIENAQGQVVIIG
ncbi:MAG: uL15 family ribosomal protein, partial [Desulfurococcaceae archaeon]